MDGGGGVGVGGEAEGGGRRDGGREREKGGGGGAEAKTGTERDRQTGRLSERVTDSLSLSLCSCLSKEVDVSEWRSEFFTDMQRFSCVCATIRCVEVALGVHHVMPQDLINYRV